MTDLEVFRIWLYRSGHEILAWWLLTTLAGLAAWPLAFRLLRRLPDRGYNVARLIGMLGVGYVLWMLGSLGFLRNTRGDAIFAWVIVLAIGVAVYFNRRHRDTADMGAWVRQHWRVILAGELLFFVLFFGWAVVRAYDPNLAGTEKPMEMAFINAIRRSEAFPPPDPWMSGYAISYYYFGYVMVAVLADLSGVVSGTAFNLSVALFFALAGVAAYSVAFNLIHSRRRVRVGFDQRTLTLSLVIALLGPLFVVIIGNLGGLVQVVWSQHALPEDFFRWLDIRGYQTLPAEPVPHAQWNAQAGWMWVWRSSRVVHDLDFAGQTFGEVIDEFPNFSFLLGDLHPHVMSLAFSLLAIGLAFNLVRSPGGLDRYQVVGYALCLGGLIFLNLLDGPLYIALMLGAEALRRLIRAQGRLTWRDWAETAGFGAALGLLGLLLYLPFFIGFRSQAGGLLPNPLFPTRFRQFFVMFGPFLIIIACFLLVEWWRGRGHMNWSLALSFGVGVLVGLVAAVAMLGLVAALDPVVQGYINVAIADLGGPSEAFLAVLGRRLSPTYLLTSVALAAVIVFVVARLFGRTRVPAEGAANLPPQPAGWAQAVLLVGAVLAAIGTFLFARLGVSVLGLAFALMTSVLLGGLVYTGVRWALALRERAEDARTQTAPSITYTAEAGFALLLIGAGAVLTLLPDYMYVADNFRTRMNTVFKFYYQGWAMWGVACAYAVYSVLGEWAAESRAQFAPPVQRLRWAVRIAIGASLLILLATVELARAFLLGLVLFAVYAVLEAAVAFALAAFGAGERHPPLRLLAARLAFGVVIAVFVVAASIFPIGGVLAETGYFSGDYTVTPAGEVVISRPDLDGAPTMFALPDDEAAIACLSAHVQGDGAVVAEAIGGSYNQRGRVAALSGIPNVLNWPGHESQWRGATYGEVAGSRESDIATLYNEPFLDGVRHIIDRYGIDYIFVGTLERRDFDPAGLAKFASLRVVCQNDAAVVYATDRDREQLR
ncbi:MAG: hypothetical protein Kow00120_09030 [Anaerolineae bacterium]